MGLTWYRRVHIERLIQPRSKLATTRLWNTTTLGETLAVQDTDVDEVYAALDWLLARQAAIQQKLATRHLHNDGVALYDVSSSCYEGHTCPLARYGHDRDGHTGRPMIVYGVLTDSEGRPVGVDVSPGNTGDPTTVPDHVAHLQTEFGIARVVLVGDRGLLTETQLRTLRAHPGIGWISALRSPAIRDLIESGTLQLSRVIGRRGIRSRRHSRPPPSGRKRCSDRRLMVCPCIASTRCSRSSPRAAKSRVGCARMRPPRRFGNGRRRHRCTPGRWPC